MPTLKRLIALLCLLAVHAASTARAQPPITIEIAVDGPSAIPQGDRARVVASLTNHLEESEPGDVVFHIAPGDVPERALPFAARRTILPPGEAVSVAAAVAPSQWFESLGTYEIWATSGSAVSTPVEIDVVASHVRVPRFVDVTAAAGLTTEIGPSTCGTWAAGAGWADVDSDGDVDLFLPRRDEPAKLWINEGGVFVDEAGPRGVAATGLAAASAVFADYDNDGDQDLYVVGHSRNVLYRNDGNGYFDDVSEAAGVGTSGPGTSASWADYDSDGHLDLYVVNYFTCDGAVLKSHSVADVLFHNNGDGTFSDRTDLLHEGRTDGAGFQAAWFDYDGDRDPDLYLAHDFIGTPTVPNYLWRNDGPLADGWKFSDVSVESGTQVSINSMGIGVGDYDRDLDLDIALSNIRSPLLLRNNADGTFDEVAQKARVDRALQDATREAITWGATFADLNNDGWEDLYFPAGRLQDMRRYFQPNALFTNTGKGRFLDHSAPSGADDLGTSRGVAVADYNRDGRLDLYVVNQEGTPHLYQNVTRGPGSHWLRIDLQAATGNPDACGALVRLKFDRGKPMMRQVFCGGTSLGTSHETVLHFGLGRRRMVSRVTVLWPAGGRSSLEDVRVDRTISIRR